MAIEEQQQQSETLGGLPGYTLAQAYRVFRHSVDRALREVGLTTPQWGTLKCVSEDTCVSGADMARMHHLTPQTMNTILQNLEHADLILRQRHPTHGTVLRIQLTDVGRERLREATGRVVAAQERMLHDFSPEDRVTLVRLLDRCIDALGREEAKDVPYPDD
jgi:DNA-binding MarR family transcriptional regulator